VKSFGDEPFDPPIDSFPSLMHHILPDPLDPGKYTIVACQVEASPRSTGIDRGEATR